MKTSDIINLYTTLSNLRERADLRIKARVSFALARNIKTLIPIVEDYDQARLKILQTWGAANPSNPNQYVVPPESLSQATQELTDLGDVDISPSLLRIKLSDIEDLDISIQEADGLELIIEEES